MKQILSATAIACALAVSACTTDATTTSEVRLDNNQLKTLLTGKTVMFSGGGVGQYATDGTYEFRGGGQVATGRYSFRNSQVCVAFVSGDSRCDTYVKRGNRYILINARGAEFRATIRG